MKWFQQNRAFGTFLIGFGICALLAVALLYWRWSAWSGAKQAFDQVATERNRLTHLDPFPSDANYRKLQDYIEKYRVALDKFKETLKTAVVPAPPLAPNEFQSRLRLVTIATMDRARVNNVRLPDKFLLGFDEFATTMPAFARRTWSFTDSDTVSNYRAKSSDSEAKRHACANVDRAQHCRCHF